MMLQTNWAKLILISFIHGWYSTTGWNSGILSTCETAEGLHGSDTVTKASIQMFELWIEEQTQTLVLPSVISGSLVFVRWKVGGRMISYQKEKYKQYVFIWMTCSNSLKGNVSVSFHLLLWWNLIKPSLLHAFLHCVPLCLLISNLIQADIVMQQK